MASTARPSFGIMTPPMNVDYQDIAGLWREADAIDVIGHAWRFDHLMPIGGDLDGPIFEGWTLLAALAAQTTRLRIGLMVTSNRFRPPAVLAKIATTVDVVSDGRLDFGIGAGSPPSVPMARRPGPPIVIGGRATATLRVVAEHADVWNIPGGDIADATERSTMLDRFCADGLAHWVAKEIIDPHPDGLNGRATSTER